MKLTVRVIIAALGTFGAGMLIYQGIFSAFNV